MSLFFLIFFIKIYFTEHQEAPKQTKFKQNLKNFIKTNNNIKNINNKSPCKYKQILSRILLVINFSKPIYSTIPILRELYGPIYKKIVFCGPKGNNDEDILRVVENNGYQGYICLVKAIEIHPTGYDGYFYTNDDVLLNFWNLNFDPQKIWIGKRISTKSFHRFNQHHTPKEWPWWTNRQRAAERCQKAYTEIQKLVASMPQNGVCNHLKVKNSSPNNIHKKDHHCKNVWRDNLKMFQENTHFSKSKTVCLVGRSDVFYIPSKFKEAFNRIASIYFKEKVFLETAVPTILNYLDRKDNFLNLKGMYYNDFYGYSKEYYNGRAFLKTYSSDLTFSHPFKLSKTLNKIFLENRFVPEMKQRTVDCLE